MKKSDMLKGHSFFNCMHEGKRIMVKLSHPIVKAVSFFFKFCALWDYVKMQLWQKKPKFLENHFITKFTNICTLLNSTISLLFNSLR